MAITQSAVLTGLVQSAEVSNQLMSVERVFGIQGESPEEKKQPNIPKNPKPSRLHQGKIITFQETNSGTRKNKMIGQWLFLSSPRTAHQSVHSNRTSSIVRDQLSVF